MGLFPLIAVLITLAAALAYLNHRLLKLPTTIGIMILAMGMSVVLLVVGQFIPAASDTATRMMEQVDFDEAVLHGLLGFLLFAGALHVDLDDLRPRLPLILTLATVGVVISTTLVGFGAWALTSLVGLDIDPIYCFLFGALISPTDPIAVLALMRSMGAPKGLEMQIAGESLFNDGVGVVVFLAMLGFAGLSAHGSGPADHEPTIAEVAILFIQETGGGIAVGLIAGYLAYLMLKSLDQYQVEVLISLALVFGGYALCDALHLSGPIAMVMAGLLIGNRGRTFAMSDTTREHLDTFWELVDEILNAVLFLLTGLELLILTIDGRYILAGCLVIPIVLLARFISVGGPTAALRPFFTVAPHTAKLMTWGGLRGAISIALALVLRDKLAGSEHAHVGDALLVMTYIVAVFSIVGQGLTTGMLFQKYFPKSDTSGHAAAH